MIQRVEDKRIVVGGMRWKTESKEEHTYDDSVVNPVISTASVKGFKLDTFPQLKPNDFTIDYEVR